MTAKFLTYQDVDRYKFITTVNILNNKVDLTDLAVHTTIHVSDQPTFKSNTLDFIQS